MSIATVVTHDRSTSSYVACVFEMLALHIYIGRVDSDRTFFALYNLVALACHMNERGIMALNLKRHDKCMIVV
jgi:hypothetical protein